ncbi:phosphatase PAP2 family protein [Candidatus Saccharibacteria bacterium]|nr:phosphatase PAP2 family protein [Candidatus Saccharibacteria bacterium]
METAKPHTKKSSKLNWTKPIFLALIATVFTVLVTKVDVQPAGVENTNIGFATINVLVHNTFGYNDTFYKLTEILGVLPFLTIAFFVVVGVAQLVKHKKPSKELLCLVGFYVVVFALYVLFEKLALNFRPVILEEGIEASYPSSHTLFAMTLCGSAILVAKRLFSENHAGLVKLGNLTLVVLALAIVFGRLFSGVHWLTDIVGGLLISAALVSILQACLDAVGPHKLPKSSNHA